MEIFDSGVLVLQLAIIAIAAVTAVATRTRQVYNEENRTLEAFPNPTSPWPLLLVTVGSGMLVIGEVYLAVIDQREHTLLFLALLLLQVMATCSTSERVVAGFKSA